jgi:hypothetical protein
MKFKLLVLSVLVAIGTNTYSQAVKRRCSTMEHMEFLKQKDPTLEQRMIDDNKRLQDYINSMPVQRDQNAVITIPVVVHVVWKTTAQKISLAQVQSQIDVLNKDFSHTNADTTNTPTIFKSKAANTGIQFCLAQRTPQGAATNGVVYKQTTVTSFTDDDAVKDTATGGDNAWDVTKYFNIWVCNLGSSLLGYAEFPSSTPSSTYGVVILYNAFGSTGTLIAPYNKGRTATHEIGHCFNLLHIWADEPNCSFDDLISDTPQQKGENYGCPTFPQDNTQPGGCCNNLDVSSMYMNYMDYTDDACMNLFTTGQSNRMNAVLNNLKPSLKTSNGCAPLSNVGIANVSKDDQIAVYPNPSTGKITLSVSLKDASDVEIRIYDSLGKIVVTKHEASLAKNNYEFDMSAQPVGLYFAQIKTRSGVTTQKFVLNR